MTTELPTQFKLQCKTCRADLRRIEVLNHGELTEEEGTWSHDLSGFDCDCFTDDGVFQAKPYLTNAGVIQPTEDDAQDWGMFNV